MSDIKEQDAPEAFWDFSNSEERHRILFEEAADGIFFTDPGGRFVAVNRRGTELTGYSCKELLIMTIIDLLPPEDLAHDPIRMDELRQGKIVVKERRIRRKDGSLLPVEVSVRMLPTGNQLGIMRDITERKKAEEVMQFTQFAVDQASDEAYWITEDARIFYVNEQACRAMGYSRKELLSMTVHDIDPAFPENRQSEAWRELRVRKTMVFESLHKTKDGKVYPVEVRANFVEFCGREYNCAFAQDITERKRAEESLRESEEHYRRFFDLESDAIVVIDVETMSHLDVNKAAEEMYGYTRQELLQLKSTDLSAEPEQTKARVQQEDGYVHIPQRFHRKKNGTIFSVDITARFFTLKGRRTLIVAMRDITDRVLTEKALQDLSFHQDALLAAIPDIIMEVDSNKVYTWANQAGLDFFGENVIGSEAAYYFEGEQNTYEVVDSLFRGEEDVVYVRSWQRRRDGQKRLLAWWCRVLKNAAGNVTGAISTARDITELKLAEEAIIRERILSDKIINSLPGIFYMFDDQGKFVRWNRKFQEVAGYSPEELFGMHAVDFFAESHKPYIALRVQSVFAEGEAFAEAPFQTKDGRQIPYFFTGQLTVLDGKHYLLGVGVDITERIQVEEEKDALQAQLLQAQKMESIGRLAGGVAHDFNNMLSAILGHTELAMMRCTPSEPIHAHLKVIEDSARRSADLTRQLLAFARKQTVAPQVLDVNDTVAGMLKMLLRLIGEDLDLVWMPGAGLWQVKIDPSQIDQILANLCVNARDAIAGVGKITIETENVAFDKTYCAVHQGFACGEYVMLAVSDGGCGMNKEVLDHLFEPFFTTKEVGKGTGLGLATVYGIVKQNEGFVNVYSEPGRGTTFKIYLPRFEGKAAAPTVEGTAETPKGRGEMVLLVEDDPVILDVSQTMLEKLGYSVLIAGTPGEALRQAKAHTAKIQLLITDVVMPNMNGQDLAKLIGDIKPGLKCLFISGYTANVIAHRGVLDEGVNFLPKPFSMKDLAFKVRQVLERE